MPFEPCLNSSIELAAFIEHEYNYSMDDVDTMAGYKQ
jgi:hypothetical protein